MASAGFGPNPYARVGLPPDAPAWIALVVALLVLAFVWLGRRAQLRLRPALERPSTSIALAVTLAALAGALSAGYIVHYLRGGPRIIDATAYWLQARALAEGQLAFPVPAPTGSFRGRFLLNVPGSAQLSGIFPPGFPLVLALGFRLSAPLAVGPLIAALLVLVTYALAWRLFARRDIALSAALLSALCATLRYHTADTMAHGWCALLLAGSLALLVRPNVWAALAAGACCGWLFATRPVSGLAAALLCGVLLARRDRRAAHALVFALGVVPGAALLALQQHAATGSWLGSTQLAYYALSDGPPGCFRYGFGRGIGCMYEHGEFVRRELGEGYGALAALKNTAYRALLNSGDIANAEPLALLALAGAWLGRAQRSVQLLAGAVLLWFAAYAPFYFPASYPGGGARLLADVLPIEHVLLAWSAHRLGCARFVVPVALLGFALHTSYAHRELAEREGGRPMFEPDVLRRAGVKRGLVFVDTDHGFNLGHVPARHDPERVVVTARARGDAHDGLLWRALGQPPAYRYRFDPFATRAEPAVEAYVPRVSPLRFEAEAEWPPLAVLAGWAHPVHAPAACVSGGRGQRMRPSAAHGPARMVIELPSAGPGVYTLVSQWLENPHPSSIQLRIGRQVTDLTTISAGEGCWQSAPWKVEIGAGPHALQVSVDGAGAVLDWVELRAVN